MQTAILLIRHGQTDWNVSRRWQGHTDIPLNETGLEQARLIAIRLESWPIQAIYSSDLKRAAKTAEVLGKKIALDPVYDSVWRERNGGDFQGLTIEQIRGNHSRELNQMRDDGLAPPNGESLLEVSQRITTAFDEAATHHEGEMIAIVGHGGSLASLIAHVLGFPPGQRARISLRGNTGLSIVEINDLGPRLTLLNDVSHLDFMKGHEQAGLGFYQS